MVLQTQRGIPVPETSDPGNPPADFQRFAQFLDPGALVPFSITANQQSSRIVFMLQGDDDPNALSIPPVLGSVFFDRSRARLWVPFTQLVNGTSTLAWYRIGADTDAEIATLAGQQVGLLRAADQIDKTHQAGQSTVILSNFPASSTTQAWTAGITFPVPMAHPPIVVACNGDAGNQPNVTVGVQNVTTTGFVVQITRSDVAFSLDDQVLINYVAIAAAT